MAFPHDGKKFNEGQSGNPNGRPKGARSLSTILREMLEEEIEVNIEGKKEKKQLQELICRKLLKKGYDGDMRAISEIFDRLEKQEVKADVKMEVVVKYEKRGNTSGAS
ncbi:MAG: DUF5681 domain-containing protein, partial [Flammeovirgaceae bacterium]